MQIRAAAPSDLADIQAIYAHHVLTGTGTFEEAPPSVEQMAGRMAGVTAAGWAWLVAADPTGVMGYGHYAQFRPRSAYRFSAEDSVYLVAVAGEVVACRVRRGGQRPSGRHYGTQAGF